MARDYKREYEQEQKTTKLTLIASKIPKTLSEDFTAKCELENVTKSAKIKELIQNYVYGEKL